MDPLDSFGLRRDPFSPEIEAHALYPFRSFQQGVLRLEHALRLRGVTLLLGDSGTGKTALIRHLAARLAPSSHRYLYAAATTVKNPLRPVVDKLLTDLGEKPPFNNAARGIAQLQEAIARPLYLGEFLPQGIGVLLTLFRRALRACRAREEGHFLLDWLHGIDAGNVSFAFLAAAFNDKQLALSQAAQGGQQWLLAEPDTRVEAAAIAPEDPVLDLVQADRV